MAQEAETPRRPTPVSSRCSPFPFCGRSRVDSKCHSSVTHVDDFDPSAAPATLPPFVCKLCTKAEGLKGGVSRTETRDFVWTRATRGNMVANFPSCLAETAKQRGSGLSPKYQQHVVNTFFFYHASSSTSCSCSCCLWISGNL